ncbi:alpha/beta hydrolase family protein [Pedobacter nutrimenti]|uniref:alpha/beta hydrolase family protein n=1 Tax=Pedobacter nutrimenti TaxID=1241337 RepID=UPI002930FE17|nr:prolyl oligopeptidase family serine peptidase [Pedobacter nutrimenti]
MRIFSTMMMVFCANFLFAQKPVIDSITYKEWSSLGEPTICKNGKYVFYNINNIPIGSKTLVVQSTDGKWKKEFRGGLKDFESKFSDRYFLFINKNDSLGILTLGTSQVSYIPNTRWCNLREIKGVEYLWYPSASGPMNFVLKNLKTREDKSFINVDSWNFDKDVLILFKSVRGNDQKRSINITDINTDRSSKIWEGYKPENLILDVKHRQLAFRTGDSVWYYKFGSDSPVFISGKNLSGIEPGLTLGYLDSFSEDGRFIFTSLIGKGKILKQKNGVVEIWSYTDTQLQTEQERATIDQKYLAIIDVENHLLIRLQQQDRELFQFSKSENAKLALVQNSTSGGPLSFFAGKLTWSLVSMESGRKKTLDFLDNVGELLVKLSPCGKYILYFDKIKQDYFSYEITTGIIRNLTKGLMVSWIDLDQDDRPGWDKERARGIVSRLVWLKNDQSVLVYDRYDIWKLDPLNIEKAVNITNGYGKKNQIIFNYTIGSNSESIVDEKGKVYLTAFNNENKYNGFFEKQLDKAGDPELLHMGSYLYETNNSRVFVGSDFSPIKAKNVEMYIVRRMSATDAPNYFSTRNFRNFTRLSDLQPQKKYNWYTTELHNWKSLDGRRLQGILYKPENFDPNSKYPVIFYYYERKSVGLNAYMKPEVLCGGCAIDIPTYVSRGYLVFTPDIYYKIGDPMQGTYDAIVSAANYVSTLSFVDAKKLGLQGCSFGGAQTNYLVTHTNLFAAAQSSSGLADFVSSYGSLTEAGMGSSEQILHEQGQIRLGASLWEKPEVYIKNSSIFQVDKVTTPLLLMHTKKDSVCPYPNIMEFFNGLRRMGKRVWMLVYSEGNHGVDGKEAEDFSVRMMQFFDHYLKDKPAPLWMLDGVSASNRSWKAGLELDTKGRTPGPSLLTAEERQKVEAMMNRKPITITMK